MAPINLNINRPRNYVEGSTRVQCVCEDLWVCLDPYNQDGITVEDVDGIIVVCHVSGNEREVVYSAPTRNIIRSGDGSKSA